MRVGIVWVELEGMTITGDRVVEFSLSEQNVCQAEMKDAGGRDQFDRAADVAERQLERRLSSANMPSRCSASACRGSTARICW